MKISVVVSVYNEASGIIRFFEETQKCLRLLPHEYQLIFVNDGSTDNTLDILKELLSKDQSVKLISFSRNFGHESAMIAGIDHSDGDAVVCMDADLQHPPAEINKMVQQFEKGAEIINMIRVERLDGGKLKNYLSKMFYRLLNRVSGVKFEQNASDFFMISRRVANLLKKEYRERARFLRGFIQVIGFERTTLNYIAPERNSGETKYSYFQLIIFSVNTILTFSNLPLRLGVIASIIVALFGFVVATYSVIMKLLGGVPPGYTTLVVLLSILFSIQFFIIGVIGEYLRLIFTESKNRPIYIIKEIIG